MNIQYKPRGVCSYLMSIELDDGMIRDIEIHGGCSGNLQGICQLVKGRSADEVITLLRGIRCGSKSTSCPDQLAIALSEALK